MTAPFEQAYRDALAHHRAGRLAEADQLYARAVALKPDLVEAHNNRGAIRQMAGDWAGALVCYDAAVRFRPDYAEALANRGNVLIQLRRYDEAMTSFERALAITPGRASALNGKAGVLFKLKRFEDALAVYGQLRAADPNNPYALGGMLIAAMNLCDWATVEAIAPDVKRGIADGTAAVPPFPFLGLSDDKALQLKCARNAIAELNLGAAAPLWRGETYKHGRIRLGYISSDFCQHPVPLLITRLIELHDRSRFEVLGFSTGLNDQSPIRARIEKAFDRFFDVQGQPPARVAHLLRAEEVDILVDLTGHTEGDHFEILNMRPCPLQVNWLGYPGTSGAASLDYILVDPVIAPAQDQPFFSETIVQLPGCYFPTSYDALLPAPSRAQAGLPPEGFVFCSFNNSWKITRAMFEVWMRLLNFVPGSVLWLLDSSKGFRDSLTREATARDIAPERLIFAPRVSPEQNLARQTLADLVLDTSPYNGHMTTSDALWAGVPMVTLADQAFAGRVAASQLAAIGMTELVTENLAAYEALALKLAQDTALLKATREKLGRNRNQTPLFDIPLLVQNVEKAFIAMREKEMTDYVGVIPAAGLASRLGPLGYPKELLPITYVPGDGGHLRPLPVIEASFRQLTTAGVSRALVITSDRKPELMQYLGNGGGIGLDLAFLQQPRPDGLAAAVSLALPWTHGANACLLLPDTIVRPESALTEARALFESAKADLVLGVLPTQKPQELGPVRFDTQMRVTQVQDKPQETDLNNSWALAIWGPRFGELLAGAVEQNAGQTLGAVFQQAVDAGLNVRAVWFPNGAFYDVGTPKGLAEALPQFLKGL